MNIKETVAKNIFELRTLNNMTQLELAEKLNYSDKTISKWERAESVPDIEVLYKMSKLFSVPLDFFVREDNISNAISEEKKKETQYNHRAIQYVSEGLAIFIALFAFVITSLVSPKSRFQWLYFVYTLPIVLIIKLVFNSIWFNPRRNYYIVSALMWSILCAIQISFWYFKKNILLIYVLGVAGQIIIFIFSLIKKPKT